MKPETITTTHKGIRIEGTAIRTLSRLQVEITSPYQYLVAETKTYVSFSSRPNPETSFPSHHGLKLAEESLAALFRISEYLDVNWDKLRVAFAQYDKGTDGQLIKRCHRRNRRDLPVSADEPSGVDEWERLCEEDQELSKNFFEEHFPEKVHKSTQARIFNLLGMEEPRFRSPAR
jgi:hypothetical protein